MKRLTIHIALTFLLLLTAGGSMPLRAQFKPSFDTDIHAIRNSCIPNFHYSYDDYLQYAPAGVMLALKAGGYESRSSWGRMLASDALSVAVMSAAVNGVKYSVGRLRPDGSRHNSFPSGHTATAFMTATMLHKEYGWRSPWFSIGGYTAAAVTGVSRLMNNRHWMTDVMAGAAIGIGSVHLGYFLGDLIFKEKGLSSSYVEPTFFYDPDVRHYVAELLFGRRFIIGAEGLKDMGTLPVRGGLAGVSSDIALAPGIGLTARLSASSMTYTSGAVTPLYSTLAGGFWNFHFARRFELQTRVMAGYAWMTEGHDGSHVGFETTGVDASATIGHSGSGVIASAAAGHSGVDLAAGVGLSIITDSNFKLKAFADFESISFGSTSPWVNTLVLGWSSAWFW